ncbi:MAG: DNA-binding response regulator [Alphaproteobacteria bacterium CG_4_10_14_0_2_um_filter_63_37]|nr:MAG: hypothetical protein AUJ55_06420 [Proteobacteria bacterium CG1_02_64_396]PJA25781.1 MAG: DNA-binding response regulator [Alphaproteobacteria bacterium CG_4_10_14_0_2_um_filter_63_37]
MTAEQDLRAPLDEEQRRVHALVVEDDPAIARLIAFHLQRNGHIPHTVTRGEQALEMLERHPIGLMLIDWMLPGLSGLELLRSIREEGGDFQRTPAIMITAKGDEVDILQAFEAGVDDYVTKPFSPKLLMARVQAVLRRQPDTGGANRLSVGSMVLDPDRFELTIAGQSVPLRRNEFRLLAFLMKYPGRVFSRDALIERVWGSESFIDDRTVDAAVHRLRKAIGDDASPVETVRGVGYRFNADLAP